MSNFNLSHDEYKYLQKTIFGVDLDAKSSRGRRQSQMEDESPSSAELIVNQYKQPEEQGFFADVVDSVQMGAWQGVGDLARGIGALFNSDWLNQAADVAARNAEANRETMSTKMQEALGQNAFDGWDSETGEGKGVANIYWWAGNLGALIGQNIDTVVTMGAGKLATTGIKAGGKLAGKYFSKEVADQVGKAAVKQASRFGIPAKYHKMIGYTAVSSAMAAGSRANQVRDELSNISNEDLAQQHGFQTAYWDLKDSEEGQSLSDNEIFERARQQYYNEVGRDVMLDPAAIAADVTANAIGGLGGGIWGMPNVNKLLGKPAKRITSGFLKGALVEAGTEGIQGAAEQYAINDTAKEYYDSDRTLTHNMGENIANSMALGAGFGGVMGGYEAGSHNRAMNRQKKRLLEAVSTGDERVDAQIRAQVEAYNRMANDLDELVSSERLQALNQAGLQAVEKNKRRAQIETELRGGPQTETANNPYHQRNLADIQAEFIQHGLGENDFNDFIEANLQQATADLQNLQTNPFRMGADLQKGLAEKQAYQAKLADAQARVNFFTQAKNAPKSGTEPSQVEGQPELQINPDDIKLSRSAMKSVEANIARGREAMTKAILDKSSVHRAMYNHELGGWVDFEWGDDGLTKPFNKKGEPIGKGIAHIIEARMRKDGMSYENVTKMLTQDIVNVIAQGQIAGHWVRNDGKSESVQIDYNGYRAGLIRNKGSNTWLLTAFELYPTDVNSAGSVDTEKTTHIKPTLTRPNMGAVGTENLPSFANDVKFSRSAQQETQSFYETEQRLGGKEAYEQAVKEGKTELDYHQWVQVRTPEFKAWFGDWENDPQNASKVINPKTGEPLVVYHGTNAEFTTFDRQKIGSATDNGMRGKGFYFSPNKMTSESYGGNVLDAFTSTTNPFDPSKFSSAEEIAEHLTSKLQEKGYEEYSVDPYMFNYGSSFSVKQPYSGSFTSILRDAGYNGIVYPHRQEVVAFDPNQIKSATDNTGEFDVNNDDIRFSFAGINAQNADNAALVEAMDMAENGVNPEEIRKQTGWFQGADGKWRFEVMEDPKLITPHQAYEDFQWQTEYNQNELKTRLGEVWKDKRLFESYPHLANLNVTIKPLSGNVDGYFDPTTREIVLSSHLGESAMRSALVHEVQHVIQARERFLNGSGLDIEKARLKSNQTGNTSVDKEIAKLEQALSQTQDPNQIAEIQASIESYKELVAENNYQRIAGEVEARNAQTRLNMTEEERQARSPESTEDISRHHQILRDYQGERAFSLNENADSDFAKAVDAVVAGKVPAGYINMGTTPDVLKMLGVGEGEVRISGGTIEKAMLNHLERHNNYDNNRHSMSPNALKRLPQQLNNPIAVFNSSTRENSFVVLTELTEFENGRNKPVIAALHFSKTKRGADLIDIASVYGRSDGQLANAFNKDLLYFNKAKGQQFLKTHPLQLHWDLTSDANLSALDIKTERDLSQYQGKQKTQAFDFTHEKSQIATAVGKGLSRHFEVTHSSELGINDPTIEAAYNTKTGKIVIIADNIRANSVLSREERLKWVAWHELAHRGLQVRYGKDFQALMEKVDQNTTIRDLATALQKDRAELKDNRILAIEEAIAELHAAYTTGKMEELKNRYGLVVPRGREISLKSWFRITAERIREFMAKIFGIETANRFSHDDLLNLLKDIQQSAGGDVNGVESDVRHSFAGENAKTANHSLLAQAKSAVANGTNPEEIRKQTGWFQGVDGKWRFEIDDSQVQVKNALGKTIGEVLDAPLLFKAYPDLAQIAVQKLHDEYSKGEYNRLDNVIGVNNKLTEGELKSVLLHELQHAIQMRENFARGGSNATKNHLIQMKERELEQLRDDAISLRKLDKEARYLQWQADGIKLAQLNKQGRIDVENSELFYNFLANSPQAKEIEAIYEHLLTETDKQKQQQIIHSLIPAWLENDIPKGYAPLVYANELAQLAREKQQVLALPENKAILREFDRLEGELNNLQNTSADFVYNRLAGEVEARNVQARLDMNKQERINHSPFKTQGLSQDNQLIYFGEDTNYSLNEDPNSSFVKAVERIEKAGLSNPKRYINMGTTPPVLQMLGLDEVKIAMRESVINKALFEHSVTAEDLKRLPEQINNPVAIMRSNPGSMNPNGLVVLTELSEVVNGKDKPLIAALQLKHNGDALEVINISSVYGRDWNTQIGNDLSRTVYWNKTKGYQFARSGGLQLPNMLTSVDNLSAFNIKTEADLSQYQNSDLRFSRSQSNVERLRGLNQPTKLDNMKDVAKAMANRPLSEWKALMVEYGKKANTKIFDALAPIKYAEDKAGISDHSQSAYTAARLAAGSASIAEASMLYGLPEYREGIIQRKNGTTEKDALFGILQALGNDANDFLAWVAGNRADKLMQEGRENHFSQAEIDELKALNRGREQRFEQARQKLMAWNQSLLDLAEHSGLINQEDRAKWEDKDFYIPFYREDDDGDAIAPYRNKGLSGQNAGIKRLKGSDKAINDLLENVITNATKLIDASVKNAAMTKAVTNLADTGVISLIENPTYADWKKLGSNKHGADKDGGVAMVRIEGKEQMVRINDAMLFNAITSIDQQPLDYPFRKLFAGPKRVLTSTVTSMPNFIVRNFLRDMAQAWVVDKNNGFKLGMDSIKGLKDAYKRSGSSIDLMFAGASFGAGYVNGGNPEQAATQIRRHLRKQGKSTAEIDGFMDGVIFTKDKLGSVLDKYFHLSHAAENANRIAVYDRAIASGKSKAQAALESKDLMDFSMHGSAKALRVLGDVLPFFNARLQGMSQLGRAFKDNPRELAKRGAMIALASVALAAMNQGEEWYEEQSDEIKDNFWLANIGGQIIKIPKPFELGVVFGTVPERLFRTMSGADDTGRFKDRLLSAISNTLSLNPIPQAVKPIFEVYNNYDSFRGREIETLSDRRLLKEARFDDRTSLFSRGIAGVTSVFGLSPKQTDHLIHGYFGTLGMYVLGMSDVAIRQAGGYGELPAKNWNEYPVLDAVFGGDVAVPRKYTRYMNDYYNFLNQVSEISATVNSYKADGRELDAKLLLAENQRLLAYKPVISQTQKALKALKAKMDAIQNNGNLSAAEKRQRLDRLRENKNAIVRMVVERMEREDF